MLRASLITLASSLTLLFACGGDDSTTTPADGDAATTPDGTTAADSSSDSSSPDTSTGGCGEFQGDARFTCSKDGNSRGKCVQDASVSVESCARGCLRNIAPADDVCMGVMDNWSCTGSFGTQKALDGDYYLTSFGCWVDMNGVTHTDPGDNCIGACYTKAKQAGICAMSDTGPQCEEKVDWFVADSGRFGCLARLRVENPKNGKKTIVLVIDAGPACSVEAFVKKAILDASGRVNEYLFNAQNGYSDKALVHVVEVDPSTPLGPVP